MASILARFLNESEDPLVDEGATSGSGNTVLLDEPNEVDVNWGVLAVDTLDKYDALLPDAESFTSDFGDQFDMEYDFLGGVLITVFGDTTSLVVVEYWRYI